MLGTVRDGVERLGRSVLAALVTAFADPRGRRLWLRRGIDLVVVADVLVAIAVYGGVVVPLITENNAAGIPYSPQLLHLVAAATALPRTRLDVAAQPRAHRARAVR